MTEVQAIIVGGIIGGIMGIGGTYFGYPLTRYMNLETIRIAEFNKAAAVFRAAFIDTIFLLRRNIETGGQFVDKIITLESLIAHEKAKIIFEPFLPDSVLDGFTTAWSGYQNCENNYYIATKHPSRHPVFHPTSIKSRKDFSQYYLSHIENLLEYAKPKI